LARLRNKVRAFEFLLGVPADLTGQKDYASLGDDAVGKAFGRFPASRMK
jgi:hypothetical protein